MEIVNKVSLILLITLAFACVEVVELEQESKVSNAVVVEGGITTEAKAHVVKLSSTHSAVGKELPKPIEGAVLSISSDEVNYDLSEIAPGIYATDSSAQAEVGKKYTLHISVDGKSYEATDSVVKILDQLPVPIEPLNSISNPQIDQTQYFQFYFRDNFGAAAPFNYQVQTTISEDVASYYPADWTMPQWVKNRLEKGNLIVADSSYYINPALEPPAVLAYGQTNFTQLLYGSKVIEKFYSVSEQHYKFIRAMLSETDWKSLGPFGYVEANVPTNLTNGAFGFFYASDVQVIEQEILK